MNKIKMITQLSSALVLFVFSLSSMAAAQTVCKQQPVETLAKSVAEAYNQKTLATLDHHKPYRGSIRVVIEHSLADDDAPDRFVVRRFASLARFERWLKSREHEEMPARSIMPFKSCARGVCSFDFDGGILHNNLYLKKITYGASKGCPYLRTIYLLDGD